MFASQIWSSIIVAFLVYVLPIGFFSVFCLTAYHDETLGIFQFLIDRMPITDLRAVPAAVVAVAAELADGARERLIWWLGDM